MKQILLVEDYEEKAKNITEFLASEFLKKKIKEVL